MSVEFFSSSFAEARDQFLCAARSAGAVLDELPLEATGPNGEQLSIAIARLGSKRAEQVLLHSSGLHGVEGFAGSALPLQLLNCPPKLAANDALIVIHVANPYGMAWLRRVNENNVDLNRNFRADDEFESAPDMYHVLSKLLNPESPPRRVDAFYLRAVWFVLRHGSHGPKQATAQGQYCYPKGLFFGGHQLEAGPCLVLDWIRRNLNSARQVVCIDVHTGLGKYGVDTLLTHYSSTSDRGNILGRTYGSQVRFEDQGAAYRVSGAYLEALERAMPDATWYSITEEFGTLGILRILKALREENRYHHFGQGKNVDHSTKRALLQAFCPEDRDWRRQNLERSGLLLEKAVDIAFIANQPHAHLPNANHAMPILTPENGFDEFVKRLLVSVIQTPISTIQTSTNGWAGSR